MKSDNPVVRAAYLQGARDAVESMLIECPPGTVAEVRDWLSKLSKWTIGESPLPPYEWIADDRGD